MVRSLTEIRRAESRCDSRIVATLGLALIPTVGFVIGLKLYTHVSPLEIGMIRALGGFLVLSLIVIWPTFDE